MEVLYPRCSGIDVHKRFLVACLSLVQTNGHRHKELRQFSTMTNEIGVCGWEEQKLGIGIRTNGLSKRSKASQSSIFGVLGRMNRPQLSCFCPHLFRPFLISKLRRSHCSAFPVSEEVFADKKASFLSPVAQNGYVPIPSFCSSQPQTPGSDESGPMTGNQAEGSDMNGCSASK